MSNEAHPQLEWKAIEDLPDDWQKLASPELSGLATVWRDRKQRLEGSPSLAQFNERLGREWAIETGLIESLYTLDRGTTQLLIENGINADLIAHDASNQPAEYVAAIVSDQHSALEGVFDFVKGNRELSTSYIKELHSVFTRRQPSVPAMDQFGNVFEAALLRGEWKRHANNPSRPDGTLAHIYTPPVHVSAEMEQLVRLHHSHIEMNVSPEIEAAWLHHRFTQIHPFQDGNGRVARTLASMVFIRAGMFPIAITRDTRSKYIDALEKADSGDLSELIGRFVEQQKRSILAAVGLSEKVIGTGNSLQEILEDVGRRLQDRADETSKEYKRVFDIAKRLEAVALDKMSLTGGRINSVLTGIQEYNVSKAQLISVSFVASKYASRLARNFGYNADFDTYSSIVVVTISDKPHVSILIVLHAVGESFAGIMGIIPIMNLATRSDQSEREIALSSSAFTFSYADNVEEVEPRFRKWLDEVILFGLDEWRRSL